MIEESIGEGKFRGQMQTDMQPSKMPMSHQYEKWNLKTSIVAADDSHPRLVKKPCPYFYPIWGAETSNILFNLFVKKQSKVGYKTSMKTNGMELESSISRVSWSFVSEFIDQMKQRKARYTLLLRNDFKAIQSIDMPSSWNDPDIYQRHKEPTYPAPHFELNESNLKESLDGNQNAFWKEEFWEYKRWRPPQVQP